MTKYHCPYCSSKYQLHLKAADGKITCGHCGEELSKIPFLRSVQVFAIIAVVAFTAPLIFLVVDFVFMQNLQKDRKPIIQANNHNSSVSNVV